MSDDLPYKDARGQTHAEGCYRWRGHHNCAVREVDRLRKKAEYLSEIRQLAVPEAVRKLPASLREQAISYESVGRLARAQTFRDIADEIDRAFAKQPPKDEEQER